jgi:pyruvate-ferredoxin/flavodoxin oxidoreductase
METRFKMLTKSNPDEAKHLWHEAQHDAETRFHLYEYLAQRKNGKDNAPQQAETQQAASLQKT